MTRTRTTPANDEKEMNALVGALPSPPAVVAAVTTAKSKKQGGSPGVVYLGRIPHGFFEDQIRAYFSQFGLVNRLRLSRNRKTGASRHYAFIEFASAEVAQIAAETMHNYLLLGHLLQCHVIEEAQIHPRMWVGANKRKRPAPTGRLAREEHNRDKTTQARAKIGRRLRRGDAAKRQRLAEEGIEYDFVGHRD